MKTVPADSRVALEMKKKKKTKQNVDVSLTQQAARETLLSNQDKILLT